MSNQADLAARLVAPLGHDSFTLLRSGVQDDPSIDVYINEQRDFAVLDPIPVMDYASYERRYEKLGLKTYARSLSGPKGRLEKIRDLIPAGGRVLEIGAADGAFLKLAKDAVPDCAYSAVEPDQHTKPARDALPWLVQYETVGRAIEQSAKFDLVMLFHVFEHVLDPAAFLSEVQQILAPGGALLIEVPSLHDPLLSLYENLAYQAFYFQRQHPYVYSAPSLERVLENGGFRPRRVIPYQRYGLENHLQWLAKGSPGGNDRYRDLFAESDTSYRRALEAAGTTDTIIVEAAVS